MMDGIALVSVEINLELNSQFVRKYLYLIGRYGLEIDGIGSLDS
jgi:hypothetical protein